MKTVGSILKEARTAKNLTLENVERDTKIRIKFLRAIEDDAYQLLPSPIYAKGFVKNYSEYLGLDGAFVMAFFRRQFDGMNHVNILPKADENIGSRGWRITPGKFLAIVAVFLVALFLTYFGLQYRKLQLPPTLTITEPIGESIVQERKLDVLGVTDPDTTITVNGLTVLVRSDGKFFTQLTLEPGVNTVTVIATSRFGKTRTEVRKVGLQQ